MMRLIMVTTLMLTVAGATAAQKRGVITGTIKPPTPGVVVVATNQVTSKSAARESMSKVVIR